jgi:hypothetical protein
LTYVAGGMFAAGYDMVSSCIASRLDLTTAVDCVCNYNNIGDGSYHSHGRTGSRARGA